MVQSAHSVELQLTPIWSAYVSNLQIGGNEREEEENYQSQVIQ